VTVHEQETRIDRDSFRSLAELMAQPPERQRRLGYAHTAQEINHQPETWIDTAERVESQQAALSDLLSRACVMLGGPGCVVLTGSGSSLFVGECLAIPIQRALAVPVSAVPSGALLTHLDGHLPAARTGLLVSFARSGNSPESSAVVEEVLRARPAWHHLIVTCNDRGRLARYAACDQVHALVLDDRTCDRSLVMTSSFTNMIVAGSALAWLDPVPSASNLPSALRRKLRDYRARIERLAAVAGHVLRASDRLANVAQKEFRSAIFLGSGARFGAARESALKMLEMTDGRVHTSAETYLGLRHGPMCAVHEDTLVACFLSSDEVTRAYELDLIRELNRKQLGTRLLVGDGIPDDIVRALDVPIECPGLSSVGDDLAAVTDVVVGQLLALFRSLTFSLKPDAPSNDNVINRVVEDFTIHARYAPPASSST
jgi:tagatose-6-phosphate ketose/aldose isomerase